MRSTIAIAGGMIFALGCKHPPPPMSSSKDAAARITVGVRAKFRNPRALGIAVPVQFASPREREGTAPTLDLFLDSGSSGITVFTSSLGDLDLERVGPPVTRTYGGGDVEEGQSARALVAIGGVATAEPILIRLVDRVHCSAERPDCPASSGREDYLRAQGFHGVLGVGMRPVRAGEIFSPLAQMPGEAANAYLIATRSHRLILGPTEDDTRGFERFALSRSTPLATLPNGAPAFDDRSVPICLSIEGTAVQNNCGTGMLDSGSWSPVFSGLSLPSDRVADAFLKEGTVGVATIAGKTRWSWTASPRVFFAPDRPLLGGFGRLLGMPFFEDYDVLFEIRAGRIGLRPAKP
jgi:hypothetical protein